MSQIWLGVDKIKYSQDSCSQYFSCGKGLEQAINGLSKNPSAIRFVPQITVYMDGNGNWVSENNRRLFTFQEAGIKRVRCLISNENGCNGRNEIYIRGLDSDDEDYDSDEDYESDEDYDSDENYQ